MRRMGQKLQAVTAFGLLLILFLAINAFSGVALRSARLDLTADRLHSLSPGTIEILSRIDEPISLQFFFSRSLANGFPQTQAYGQRVIDMLKEIVSAAKGQVRLEIVEPVPFGPAEDQAVSLGLTGVLSEGGEKLYFGVSGHNMLDGRYAIPFFTRGRESFLEYDISKMIDSLSEPDRPRIGVITTLPLDTGPGGIQAALRGLSKPYAIYEELRSQFDVEMLSASMTSVGEDFDVLLLANPPDFDDLSTYALDQYALRGGKMIILVDPFSEISMKPGPDGTPTRGAHRVSRFEPLLSHWGVDYPENEVVLDRARAHRVAIDAQRGEYVDYLAWIGLGPNDVDKNDPVTSDINELNLASVGHLRTVEKQGIVITPLIMSSDDARREDAAVVRGQPDPKVMLRNFKPSGVRYTLALRLSGQLSTAFPDGPPSIPDNLVGTVRDRPAHLTTSTSPANIIVLADTDILDDRFWVSRGELQGRPVLVPVADNANFLLNAVDNLTGSNALISLRSRGVLTRPFERIDKLRREAETRYLTEQEDLQTRLQESEKRLSEMQAPGLGNRAALNAAEKAEVINFEREILQTRGALRDVRRNLNAEVEELKTNIRLINIGLVPVILVLIMLGLVVLRRVSSGRITK